MHGITKSSLVIIFVVVLLDVLGLGILLPVAAFIVRRYDTSALAVSMLTVIYAAAQFVAAPMLGSLSDRYGRRPVLVLSVLGSALGYYLFGIGGALWVLFISRLMDGITGGSISTAYAFIADVTPPPDRARNYAWLGAAFGIGLVAGPALGGVLAQIRLTAPAFAAGTFSLLGAAVAFLVLPESLPENQRRLGPMSWAAVNPFASMFELLGRPSLSILLITFAVFNVVFNGRNSVLPVLLIGNFNVQPAEIGALFFLSGITLAVVQVALTVPLLKRFGEKTLTGVGLVMQSIGTAGMILAPALWMLYPIAVLSVGAAGLTWPALAAMGANRVRPDEQGKLSGVSTSLGSLTSVVGPLGAGAAYDAWGPPAPFWISSILLVLAGVLFARLKMPQEIRGEPNATERPEV